MKRAKTDRRRVSLMTPDGSVPDMTRKDLIRIVRKLCEPKPLTPREAQMLTQFSIAYRTDIIAFAVRIYARLKD